MRLIVRRTRPSGVDIVGQMVMPEIIMVGSGAPACRCTASRTRSGRGYRACAAARPPARTTGRSSKPSISARIASRKPPHPYRPARRRPAGVGITGAERAILDPRANERPDAAPRGFADLVILTRALAFFPFAEITPSSQTRLSSATHCRCSSDHRTRSAINRANGSMS